MINDRIVFVLGAGASMPFGFPSGKNLVREILKIRKEDVPAALDGKVCKQIMTDLGVRDDLMVRLQVDLHSSQVESIDAFLAQPGNDQYLELGRFLIASLLIPCEEHGRLFGNDKTEGPQANWYRLVWNNLLDYESIDAFREHLNLTFVTFNYDRSLEHFFYTVMKHMFQTDDAEICGYLRDNIFHVHGTLAPYCRIDPKAGRRYMPKRDLAMVKRGMNGIRVVHEVGKIPDRPRIVSRIENADRLVFLGFGYAPDNIAKLFNGVTRPPKRVMGTSFGLSTTEVTTAKRRIATTLGIDASSVELNGKNDLGCHDWLREHFEFA